jgi:hypothetical protein
MPPRSTRRRPPRAVHTPTPSANYSALVSAYNVQQASVPAVVPTGSGTPTTAPSAVSNPVGVGGTAYPGTTGGGVVGAAERFTTVLPTYLKIAAGGIIVTVSGLALVYVAGRNTAPVQAAKTAAKVATPVGKAASAAAGATRTGVKVSEARGVKKRARENVRTRERQEARSAAEDRLRISRGRSGRERVRMTSPKQAASDKAATSRARSTIKRQRLKALKAA